MVSSLFYILYSLFSIFFFISLKFLFLPFSQIKLQELGQIQGQEQHQAAALENCLKMLSGDRDEQRLAGLLLVPKLCHKDDHDSIRKVYHAIGVRFLDRLLRTGMGKGNAAGGESDNRDAYLHLSITVLAVFCRVPEIAASSDMVSKIPLVMQVMEKESAAPLLEDCYEFLFLISSVCENVVTTLFESGGLKLLAAHLPSLPDGSQVLELCLRLVQLILSKIPLDAIFSRHLMELSTLVDSIARHFALMQNALKFDLLQLLCILLSSDHLIPLHNALRAISSENWPAYVRAGVVDILQNRVATDQKLQALIIAESMVSMLGEGWLIGNTDASDLHVPFTSDRCLLLVLESTRVEIAVLLNELAYIKYEALSSKADALPLKRHNLAIAFSLVEKIIKLISNLSEDGGETISEGTLTKVISGLNETLEVVLEYLKDAKDHGQTKGDDILACVRVAGSYLAEAPSASQVKVKELLGYLLSVEGENESSPFHSICFLLPMLCQTTMTIEGVKVLASSGGYKAVINCLVKLIGVHSTMDDDGCIFLACDTVMNILLKREHFKVQLDESYFVHLLKALANWTEGTSDSSILMMASSICSLIFEGTSEEVLLRHPEIDTSILHILSNLIGRSLATCRQLNFPQDMCNDRNSEADLLQIIVEGFSRWADRFPLVKKTVEQMS